MTATQAHGGSPAPERIDAKGLDELEREYRIAPRGQRIAALARLQRGCHAALERDIEERHARRRSAAKKRTGEGDT